MITYTPQSDGNGGVFRSGSWVIGWVYKWTSFPAPRNKTFLTPYTQLGHPHLVVIGDKWETKEIIL